MGLVEFMNEPFLGSSLRAGEVILSLFVFVMGAVVSVMLPPILSRMIETIMLGVHRRELAKSGSSQDEIEHKLDRKRARYARRIGKPLIRSFGLFFLLSSLGLSLLIMDVRLSTNLSGGAGNYELWRFIQWGLFLSASLLIALLLVDPVLRFSIYNISSSGSKRKYSLFRSIKKPTKFLVVTIGSFIGSYTAFGDVVLHGVILHIHLGLFIIISTVIIANAAANLMETAIKPGRRGADNSRKIMGRLLKAALYVIGVMIALVSAGIDLLTVATLTGLLGLALAFGLQDTVANFAAGILINVDRPFVIGDRIRVSWGNQDTWGDVKDISLRSTWIRTPEEEMIVIPNSVIANSQIWNYTRDSPRLAVHFDIGISYESDWRLAERLVIGILRSHPLVMNKPEPFIEMKEFSDSSVVLSPWFWIPEARDKHAILSDLRKRIKDAFDINGVEIPYPHLTLVHHKDLPKPGEAVGEYKSPMHLPSLGFSRYSPPTALPFMDGGSGGVILATTSASYAAKCTAPTVMDTAKKMNATVSALFVRSPGSDDYDGQRALRIYNEVAKHYGIGIKLVYKEGDVLEKILESVEEEKAKLVIMGTTEETIIGSLTRKSVSQELQKHLHVPSMIIPFKLGADRQFRKIAKFRDREMKETKEREKECDYTSLASLEDIAPAGLIRGPE